MKTRYKQSALTLTEMVVVIATVSLLTVFGLPAVRAFLHSLASSGNARAMISAGLASARAIAAKEQRYAGIRFQKAYHLEGPLEAPQYMIFIVHDFDKTGLAPGFRAVEGLEPIKLPDSVGVMDLKLGVDADKNILSDGDISSDWQVRDTTAFSIVFSPSGKLVIHNVRVRNRNGKTSGSATQSRDDIFNTERQVTDPIDPVGMFIQDDYAGLGLGKEPSRNGFIIYETEIFRQAQGQPYSGYLVRLAPEPIYINPYTGTIISSD